MNHISIEIKAKCPDLEKVRKILKFKKADFRGIDHQIDTYFKVNHGRLKLREGKIENYLIYYDREDIEGPKQSNVSLFKTSVDSSLKGLLEKSLGTNVVVDKLREIYFIGNVKFHLDKVNNLGEFIEIEALSTDKSLTKSDLYKQCQSYLKLFGIEEKDLLSNSYSDLLIEKDRKDT